MLQTRILAIQSKIARATLDAGRPVGSVRLLAVSKKHSAESVAEAHRAGLREFAENYADELCEKAAELKALKNIRWVFVGQLQSNKIGKIVRCADEVQSVATEKHARLIDRSAKDLGRSRYPVWIVVNAAAEDSKQGVSLEELPKLVFFIVEKCEFLALRGIMAIPPASYSDEVWAGELNHVVPSLYQDLRKAADGAGEGLLSLGMTGDLALSVAAGSDCVRIGTAIFGERDVTRHQKA
jgi:pyridoxal phosphate enzyme (YggS family)